eukprot:151626_1
MSIMLHNFEEFDIDYKYFTSSNTNTLTQYMDHQEKSYQLTDALSLFYGVSNSIVSVLDSISDISFIAFLWYYDGISNTINAFLGLTLGNVLSVAVLIALYMSREMKAPSLVKRIGRYFKIPEEVDHTPIEQMLTIPAFFVFLLLSPCLAGFEWILKKFQIDTNDFLVVSPTHDGILLWYQEELIKNKIFFLECIFESTFQIIIQFMALFEFKDEIGTAVYLYMSIIISLFVIMSKFILMSYNLRRPMIGLNALSYFMDIFYSLVMSIFVGSFVFQQIFSVTGMYLVFEIMTFTPFYCYYFSHLLFENTWYPVLLVIAIFLFLLSPFLTFSLSAFSMYPLLNYLITNPEQIGQKEEFYTKLYEYCNESKDDEEFEFKIIIINY